MRERPLLERAAKAIAIAAVAGSALVYAGTLFNGFAFDDLMYIVPNESIRDFDSLGKVLDFTGGGKGYRPIRNLVNVVNYAACGLEPFGWHLVNLLLHVAATALVLAVANRLLGRGSFAAAAAALVFALHPVHTEAIANVSGRKDALATIFFLLGWLAHLRYRETGRARDAALVFAALALGFLSKEMALSLPLVLLLHEVAFGPDDVEGSRGLPWALRRAAREVARRPVFFGAFGAGLVLATAFFFFITPASEHPWWGGSPLTNYLTVGRIHAHYAGLLVAPVTLVGDYSFDAFPVTTSAADPAAWVALAGVVAFALGAAALFRRRPIAAFCALFVFVTLLPVSHLKPHHELAGERFLYLPSIGFALLLGHLAGTLAARPGASLRLALAPVILVSLAYAGRTIARNRDWKDDVTFWTKTIADAPRCARAHRNLAYHLFQAGRREEAFASMERSLAIEPDSGASRFNLAIMLEAIGDSDRAIEEYRVAKKHFRFDEKAMLNLGILLGKLGRLDDAEREFRELLDLDPEKGSAWFNLGVVMAKRGRTREAEECYLKAIRAEQPFDPPGLDPATLERLRAAPP